MLPGKYAYSNGHVSAFCTIFRQVNSYFWPLILNALPNMMHFVRSFDYACLRRLRHTVMKRFEIMGNFVHPKHR